MNKRQFKKLIAGFGVKRAEVAMGTDGVQAIGMIDGTRAVYIHVPKGDVGFFISAPMLVKSIFVQKISTDEFERMKKWY